MKLEKITLEQFITRQPQRTFLYPTIDGSPFYGNTRGALLDNLMLSGLQQIVNVRPDGKSAKCIKMAVVWTVTTDAELIERLTAR